MALPFVLGLAAGAGAVIAFSKREDIKEKLSGAITKGKEVACEAKSNFDATKECIKDKKEQLKEEKCCEDKEVIIHDSSEQNIKKEEN